MKVQIIKPGDFSWYDNHLGEIFNVIEDDRAGCYRVVGDDNPAINRRRVGQWAIRVFWIEKNDCQVVPEPEIKNKNRYQILKEQNVF
jgi:hypothetical protein